MVWHTVLTLSSRDTQLTRVVGLPRSPKAHIDLHTFSEEECQKVISERVKPPEFPSTAAPVGPFVHCRAPSYANASEAGLEEGVQRGE